MIGTEPGEWLTAPEGPSDKALTAPRKSDPPGFCHDRKKVSQLLGKPLMDPTEESE